MAAYRCVILIAGLSLSLDACTALPAGASESTRDEALLLSMATFGNLMDSQQEWDLSGEAVAPGKTGLAALPSSPSDLNAVLLLIAQTAAWCNQTGAVIAATMPEGPREAAAAELDRTCSQELARLERRAQALERGGGKRRSWWRRTVAGRFLGWVGRDVVKPALPDVAMALATGGGGLAAKRLVLRQGRRALEKELRSWGGRTLARKGVRRELLDLAGLPPGPERLSRVATEAPVQEGTEGPPTTLSAEEWSELIGEETAPPPNAGVFELPTTGSWKAVCRHRWPGDWKIDWVLTVDLSARTFASRAEWTWDELKPDGWLYRHLLSENGSGSVYEDGVLEGSYNRVESVTWSKDGRVSSPQVSQGVYGQYGVIAGDLRRICISRGLQPGSYDPAYVRSIGRNEFFASDKGCEGECMIVTGP